MRFTVAALALVASVDYSAAFAPSFPAKVAVSKQSPLFSTVETATDTTESPASTDVPEANGAAAPAATGGLSASDINARLEKQLAKLKEKDSTSPELKKEDIKVVFEDDHLVVVDKPAGVLSVPNKEGHGNLAQAVCASFGCEMGSPDKMTVHRLGMDTSGLIVYAKTMDAVRGMNAIFRTRKIERQYEALVCGHIAEDQGIINLPLMRDYEFPPFMRVSTDEHQHALAGLDAADVGKKLLELPKDSLTKYEVVAREEFEGEPVTRVSLTSVSGRTHQLNVHLAAFGHPIVGDTTYGINGDAAPCGGLTSSEMDSMIPNSSRAGEDSQKKISSAAKRVCIHAKSLKFRHPVTKEEVSLTADAPF